MADELEPYVPEIEPTAVYGPDDWRPYSQREQLTDVGDILADVQDAVIRILSDQVREHAKGLHPRTIIHDDFVDAMAYGLDGSQVYSDGTWVREYRVPGEVMREAERAVQDRMRATESLTIHERIERAMVDPEGAARAARLSAMYRIGLSVTDPASIMRGIYSG